MVDGRCIIGSFYAPYCPIGSRIQSGMQPSQDCDDRAQTAWRIRLRRNGRRLAATACEPRLRAMDRRLARRNLRTALITAVIGLLMFALTFVAALLYVA